MKKLVIEPTVRSGIETILHSHIQGMKDIIKNLQNPEFDTSQYPEWVNTETIEKHISQYNDMYAVLRCLSTFNQEENCKIIYANIDEHISALQDMKDKELEEDRRESLDFNINSWKRMKFLIKMMEYAIKNLEETDNSILQEFLDQCK